MKYFELKFDMKVFNTHGSYLSKMYRTQYIILNSAIQYIIIITFNIKNKDNYSNNIMKLIKEIYFIFQY